MSRVAYQNVDSRERLGRNRWVAERTLACLHRFRCLRAPDERRAYIYEAIPQLAAALTCWFYVRRAAHCS